MRATWAASAATGLLLLASSGAAAAESLQDALALAYDSNPVLLQQRAQLRALDETYVQARTGFRPTLSLSGSAGETRLDPNQGASSHYGSNSLSVNAAQPLYTGGRTTAQTRAAENQVLAGRQTLRNVESQILQQVVQAYMDVRRDQQILAIRRANVEVLQAQLDETTAKMKVGQLTATDVAQARAQAAQSRALAATAEGQLNISRAAYLAVVGRAPGALDEAPTLPGLPASVDAAFALAEANNPAVLAADYTERAALANVAAAKSGRLPTVTATASAGYSNTLTGLGGDRYDRQLSATVTVTQPLYSGGLVSSQIRAALDQDASARFALDKARRDAVQSVSSAWSNILSTTSSLSANLDQQAAADLAFKGVREQYRAGVSTTLDVLIAQQTQRDADLAVVNARHDQYLAQANLLAALGRLEARALAAPVAAYDPVADFQKVKNANATPLDQVVETAEGLVTPRR